jgi:hypothetical protein
VSDSIRKTHCQFGQGWSVDRIFHVVFGDHRFREFPGSPKGIGNNASHAAEEHAKHYYKDLGAKVIKLRDSQHARNHEAYKSTE